MGLTVPRAEDGGYTRPTPEDAISLGVAIRDPMTELFAARSQMALSLAFHMVFATVGIGMPLLMAIAEGLWLRTGEPVYLELAKRWAKGTAILFAVGAVSGTVLSFELGLLWPGFMAYAGPIIGMPFSLEGFAFFFEAIFLGVYLYGWDRLSPRAHWLTGVGVMVSGALSGIFVVTANAWMNNPTGFTLLPDGTVTDVQPFVAMFNPGWFPQTLHMTVASFLATAFGVAGVHAWLLLRDPGNLFHRRALGIALTVGVVTAVLQPLTGHVIAEHVAHAQPEKLAAMEAHWDTQRGAPFIIGGWPDEAAEQTRWGLEVPYLLSWLAYGDVDAEVMGLKDVPRDERPPVVVTHLAYQLMLASMATMGGVAGLAVLLWWRRREVPQARWFLGLAALNAPMGILGIEAGWVVTEVGRQPWVIWKIMRTADAVTPMPGLFWTFTSYTLVYVLLTVLVAYLMARQFAHSPRLQEFRDGP